MHSIASKDIFVHMDFKRFMFPKLCVSGLFFINFVTMRIYVYIKFNHDSFFDNFKARHFNTLYTVIKAITIFLISLYSLYFGAITYKAIKTIKHLNPSYRFAIGTTLFTIVVSGIIVLNNG